MGRGRKMRSRSLFLAVLGAATALLVGAVVAYADTIKADGDIVKSGNNVSYTDTANFTQRCAARGTPVAGVVAVKYNGNGTHFDPGAALTISLSPDAAGTAAGISATGGTTTMPDPWDTNGQTFTTPISTTVPPTAGNGTYVVTVSATGAAHDAHDDPVTFTTQDTYDVSVDCAAVAPTISWVSSPSSANEGDVESYQFSISDPDSTSWSFAAGSPSCGSAGSLSGAPSIDSSSKTGTFSCGFPNGPATSTVSVAVSDGASSSNVLAQAVSVANVAPTVGFTSPPTTAYEGETKTFAFAVSDPGNADTYAPAAGFPSCGTGGTLVSGSLTVTGDHGSQTGSFACSFPSPASTTVSIAFTDSDGATGATATAPVTVQDAPLSPGALAITDGVESLTASHLTFGFTDANPAGAAGDYSATIDWGDSTTSAGVVTASGSGFTVQASHTYVDEGTYAVTVTVADSGGATTSATGQAHVADAPLTAGTLTVGDGVAGVTPAALTFAFSDANPVAPASDFTATIDWGDSTTSTGTVVPSSGGFAVQASHTYTHSGSFPVTVTVADTGGSTTSATGHATVASAPLTPGTLTIGAGVEGITPSQLTFGFTDANPAGVASDYSATIDWGDATSSAGTVTAASGGFTVQASHTYADEGTYAVTVTVTSAGGSTASATGHAVVADAPLTAGAVAVTNGVAGSLPAQLTFGFTDANPAAPLSDFTATIAWGDSTTSVGTVAAVAAGAFSVQASHTYAHPGTFTVTVTVADTGGSSTTGTGQAAIAASALTAGTLTIGGGVEGTTPAQLTFGFTSVNPLAKPGDFTATISWGDRKSSAGTVIAVVGGGFSVKGSHVYDDEGSYKVTVKVTDTAGNAASATGRAAIADAPLTATAPALAPTTAFVGTTATFTDANPNAPVGDFDAKIDWGDGDRSRGLVVRTSGGFAVKGAHLYRHTGYFTIKTKIFDEGGSTASASTQVLIFAFPRRGAFVIGDRSATGSVTFFSSQWWRKNSLSGGPAPSSFTGYASDPRNPSCHARWTAGSGDDAPDDVPDYMAVIVSSSITKSGWKITGDTVHMVIVHTSSGWHSGTGTVVAAVPGC